jgi:hypothetical protein
MEGRLSAGHTDAVHPSFKRTKTVQGVLHRNGTVLFRLEDQRMIVAIRTAEIAVGEKEYRADLPRPIDKRRL